RDPWAAFRGRIGIGGLYDFADADHGLVRVGVVVEHLLARLHRHQVQLRAVIAHAGPRRALLAGLHEIVPRKDVRLRLHKPIGHTLLPQIREEGVAYPAGSFQSADNFWSESLLLLVDQL